jgi:triacylglycerol lipase
MLATVLRLFILFELACYATLALRVFGASALAAGLAALVGVLLMRLWLVALVFALGWSHRLSAPRLGAWRMAAMMAAEYAAFVVNFVVISPSERWWMGGDRLRGGVGRPPLLLIHGYGCSRGAWWWLRRRLEAAGWNVATINLEPIYTSIENYVEPVSRRIDEVLEQTGVERLVLVGHSMGGLVARAYLRRHGAAKVVRLITLGSPHGGSELARIALGENARQMRPGNPWLVALASAEPAVDTWTLYSPHDNYVLPHRNLDLPGARRCTIAGLGHLAMLFSPRVSTALLAALSGTGGAATPGLTKVS